MAEQLCREEARLDGETVTREHGRISAKSTRSQLYRSQETQRMVC